jgi:methyl-accepting chemotaxis protein
MANRESKRGPRRMLGLGQKLALFMGFALFTGIGVVTGIGVLVDFREMRTAFIGNAARSSLLLSQTLGGAVRFGRLDNVESALAGFRRGQESAIAWMAVVDAGGAPIVVEDLLSEPDMGDVAQLASLAQSSGQGVTDGTVTAAPILLNASDPPVGALVVGWSDTDLVAAGRSRAMELAGVALLLSLLTTGAAYLVLARLVSRPIRQMDRCLTELAAGQYDCEVPDGSRSDEVGAMARNLEELRRALAAARAQEAQIAAIEEAARAERAAMLEALRSGVGSVVAAVQTGDFSRKVDLVSEDETLRTLANDVNAICDIVSGFLNDSEAAVTALSRGDLGRSMSDNYSGRFSEVARAINATLERLKGLVVDLQETEASILETVTEIAQDAQDLSQRAVMQATALQETSATMTELSTTIRTNADNARASAETVGDAQGQADASRRIIAEAVGAMQDIAKGTQEITEIVNAIDGFAFQTNLLALNAAVEAARAGDAGKGFAVVASEVRTLAQRAADAAKDIKRLILVSLGSVENGTRVVDATGSTLSDILNSFVAIAPAMADISHATREQSLGVSELATMLAQIDEATQQSAQIAEKGALQAHALRKQAESLSRLIAFFRPEAAPALARMHAAE